jgi:hypothetical protein
VHVSFIRRRPGTWSPLKGSEESSGGLPEQDWSLRVSWVFGRTEAAWELAHRHADPLVHPSSPERRPLLERLALKDPTSRLPGS